MGKAWKALRRTESCGTQTCGLHTVRFPRGKVAGALFAHGYVRQSCFRAKKRSSAGDPNQRPVPASAWACDATPDSGCFPPAKQRTVTRSRVYLLCGAVSIYPIVACELYPIAWAGTSYIALKPAVGPFGTKELPPLPQLFGHRTAENEQPRQGLAQEPRRQELG